MPLQSSAVANAGKMSLIIYQFFLALALIPPPGKCDEISAKNVDAVEPAEDNLTLTSFTKNSVILRWDRAMDDEYYRVKIVPPDTYPDIAACITNKNNITINNLAPGVTYTFVVSTHVNNSIKRRNNISYTIQGSPLPSINTLQIMLMNDINSIKLKWEKPSYLIDLDWMYAIYYGENKESLMKSAKYFTKELFAVISGLDYCKNYLFSVGVVGPLGQGPISQDFLKVSTPIDRRSPPRNLTISTDFKSTQKLIITWESSCGHILHPIGYYIVIKEHLTSFATIMDVEKSTNTTFQAFFNAAYGGIYDVKISTDELGARPSKTVPFHVPYFLQPYNVEVKCQNGTYIIAWKEPEVPRFVGQYKYEVIVSVGNTLLDLSRFDVQKPPFVYKYNLKEGNYTFAVALKTSSRMRSTLSESVTAYCPQNN